MLITVTGANGYQAGLVLAELSSHEVEIRLVGRDADRLETAATKAGCTRADRRVTAFDDHAGLVAALSGSDAVINCAGPFTASGAAVVRAAIDAGAHYVDTAGEQLYLQAIFDTFTDAARTAACDGGAFGQRRLPAHGSPGPSARGGGRATDGTGGQPHHRRWQFVPRHPAVGPGDHRRDHRGRTDLSRQSMAHRIPARHSNITLPDGEVLAMAKMPTCEVITIPRHVQVDHVEALVEAALMDQLAGPVAAGFIDSLPAGPTPDERAGQRFTYLLDAVNRRGRRVRGVIQGKDTYGCTAIVAVRAARRLAAGDVPAGVLAPAQAFDPAEFLTALTGPGLTWSIHNQQP